MAAPSLQQLRDLTLVDSLAALEALRGDRLRIDAPPTAVRRELKAFQAGSNRQGRIVFAFYPSSPWA
ncbi:MAG: hypothetical protein VKM17_02340 [Cyanobacteriota bacterium]|nr:hypothetical protein [Cyanobacteriota bacterium]